MFKIRIFLTTSKLLAFLILILGFISLFIINDKSIFELAIITSGSLMGIKTFSSSFGKNDLGHENETKTKTKPKSEIG